MRSILMFTSVAMVFLFLILSSASAQTLGQRDLKNYDILTTIKAALISVQNDLRETVKDKDGKDVPVLKPELSASYDKAAIAFNKANDSWKVLELAKKLGKGDGKARNQFESDLASAIALNGSLQRGRGIIP